MVADGRIRSRTVVSSTTSTTGVINRIKTKTRIAIRAVGGVACTVLAVRIACEAEASVCEVSDSTWRTAEVCGRYVVCGTETSGAVVVEQ